VSLSVALAAVARQILPKAELPTSATSRSQEAGFGGNLINSFEDSGVHMYKKAILLIVVIGLLQSRVSAEGTRLASAC
jgi:Asp/Glu/hydantoin racemase